LSGIGEWLDQMRKKKDESRRLKEENRLEKEERRLLEKGAHKKKLPADSPVSRGIDIDTSIAEEPLPVAPIPMEPHLETQLPQLPGEPEMVIRQGVREKEADLDERQMKVKTKDREPYRFPSVDLLEKSVDDDERIDEHQLAESKRKLLEKLNIYKIEVLRISTTVGPRVTLFEMELAPDVKISRVKALENDLAMALAARGIRIIAPIPGKNAVGVEIPNGKPKNVLLRSVLQVEKFKNSKLMLPIVLGKTIANEVYIDDLTAMPHLLIAGATGAGKSVCINVIISSLLYSCSPDKVQFVLIDPKRVELFHYQHLKNHFLVRFPGLDEQIITEPQKAVYALKCVEKEMEHRYETLEKAGVRNIGDYNRRKPAEAMFYLVVVIDELADLMITAGRDVEEPITRLAQLSRAVGIHLIVATQRPSVDIITGIIKANFPSRIAFQVASKVDSRTILDGSGAEQLLGNGDMLYQPASQPKSMRLQSPYVSSGEVEEITRFIGRQQALKNIYMLPPGEMQKGSQGSPAYQDKDGRDSMFEDAARLVVMHQQASVSLLQRRLRLGFSRAARVMDQLEYHGIVSEADGSRPREVLVNNEDSLELLLRNLDE
ncbi:MAG: DNA translocase FtsK, partial [Chlorobiaceae bacterium]|nr:DNA translocase FtsK [Chlorobiaceae bacterium]